MLAAPKGALDVRVKPESRPPRSPPPRDDDPGSRGGDQRSRGGELRSRGVELRSRRGPHRSRGDEPRPADVRFTPTTYLWAYGDGTTSTKSTPGGTWAAQGIAEFEPTPTSHVYEQLGDYTITLSIVFAAEYRFAGGPWRPVVGTITLPANDLHIRVGTAKTVLVEHDCLANPAGPGC